MRNNYLLLLLTVLFIGGISSCKKSEESCQLGRFYVTNGNTSQAPNVFSYYDNSKLQSIRYPDGSLDTLYYIADTIFVKHYDRYDSLLFVLSGITNGAGHLTTGTKVSYDFGGNVTATDNYSNEYNAEGNLTKQTITNQGGTSLLTLTYEAGNATLSERYTGAQLTEQTVFFRSKTDNKTGIDDIHTIFAPYFGKPSNQLLDSVHIFAASDTTRVQFAHTLDENGYVLKTVQTYLNPIGVQTQYQTYQYFNCK